MDQYLVFHGFGFVVRCTHVHIFENQKKQKGGIGERNKRGKGRRGKKTKKGRKKEEQKEFKDTTSKLFC